MIGKTILLISFVVMLGACSTVTIQPKNTTKLTSTPTYEKSLPFYMLGLVGEPRVNVVRICGEKSVIQMQSQQTFSDSLLTALTLGIYAPHSAKVWCE